MDKELENEKILDKGHFWKDFGVLLKPFKNFFWPIAVSIILAALAALASPYFLKLLIDGLSSSSGRDWGRFVLFVLAYFLLEQAASAFNYFNDRWTLKLLVEVEYRLGIKAQSKLLDLDLSYHEKENTGSKIVKIERGIDKVSMLINNLLYEVAPTIIQIVFTLLALFWSDWRRGVSFLIFAPLCIFVSYKSNKKMHPIRKQIYKDYEKASGKMGQAIININAVQSFVQEEREYQEFEKIKEYIRENEDQQWSWMMRISWLRNLFIDLGRISILLIGAYLIYLGEISLGTLFFAFTLCDKAFSSLIHLSRSYDRLEEGREGVRRLLDLFQVEKVIKDAPDAFSPKKLEGEIEFKKVSFAYSGDKKFALRQASFSIPAGKITALVGPSGGGKTTVARLIYRHYDPVAGQIVVDGRNLASYKLHDYRRLLAIVPQEVEIFDLSVSENISYSHPQATLKEIKAAAKIANAEEFISKLSQGYQTMVGERGVKLSGGQRQRIGIARAILANPRILIFDEATSNLDSQSEALIQEAMEKISRGRTMIVIAHRLSTIKKADKIIVLENGVLAEEGTHEELASLSGGLYAKLLKLQDVGELE
jgi:ABC-type multidrug transport system fused ATPase/permease subunit